MYTGIQKFRVGSFEALIDIKDNALQTVLIGADIVGRGRNDMILKNRWGTDHDIEELLEVLYILQKELEQWQCAEQAA